MPRSTVAAVTALLLCAGTSARVRAQGELITGAWSAGSNAHFLWVGADWNGIIAKNNEFAQQGQRLTDLEVIYDDTGGVSYAGVWRPGSGATTFYKLEWPQFVSRVTAQATRGQRLVRLRAVREGNKLLFAGVFRTGTGSQQIFRGPWTAFRARWQTLSGQGMRLVTFDRVLHGDSVIYVGVFRPGTDAHYFLVDARYDSFLAKQAELQQSGLQLVELRSYRDGDTLRWAGAWRRGTVQQVVHAAPAWDIFNIRKAKVEVQPGMRLFALAICSRCGVVSVPGDRAPEFGTRLIASLGDSYASGEGAPDVNATGCVMPLPNTPMSIATRFPCASPPRWLANSASSISATTDRACHRSGNAGPVLAGRDFLLLANNASAAPYRFVSVACSGAEIDHLYQRRYNGNDLSGDTLMPPQLIQIREQFPNVRSIDALVISAAGNDVGFGDKVMWCVSNEIVAAAQPIAAAAASTGNAVSSAAGSLASGNIAGAAGALIAGAGTTAAAATPPTFPACQDQAPPSGGPWGPWEPVSTLQARVANRYRIVADSIRSLFGGRVGNVFLTEYPDPMFNSGRSPCGPPPPLGDPLDGITTTEAQFASDNFIRLLNEAVAKAARDNQFRFIGGIAAPFNGRTQPESDAHGYCARDPWLNTIKAGIAAEGSPYGGVHPNTRGHQIYRTAILTALRELLPPARPELSTSIGAPSVAYEGRRVRLSWGHDGFGVVKYQLAIHFEDLPRAEALPNDEMPHPPGRKGDAPELFQRQRALRCVNLHDGRRGACISRTLGMPPGPNNDRRASWSDWLVIDVADLSGSATPNPPREFRYTFSTDPATKAQFYFAVRACTAAACSAWSQVLWAKYPQQ